MRSAARWLRLSPADAAITVAVVAWALAEAVAIDGRLSVGWRVAFAIACTVPMVLRNRAPVLALGIAAAAFVADLVFDVLPIEAVTPIQLLPLATYALASLGPDRRLSGSLAIAAVLTPPVLYVWLVHDGGPVTVSSIVSLVVVQSVAAGAGWAVRLRHEEAERGAARLRAVSEAADDALRAGLGEERSRIARELRAIVARNLAAMERLLGDGGTGPEAMRATATELQRRSAGVMAELQRLLGVLHDEDPGVASPVTALAAVGAARARGWPIELLEAPEAPPGATVAAGRVIEEVLAGAAPGTEPVRVRIVAKGGGLALHLAGVGAPPPALEDPVALGSLRERVRLHGGTAQFVRRRRRWAVHVVLPGGAAAPRPSYRAYALGDAVVVGSACLMVFDDAQAPGGASPAVTAVLGALFFVLPLALRRRAPLAAVLTIAAGLLILEALGVFQEPSRTPAIAALLGAGTAAMHLADRRTALLATAAVGSAAVAVNLIQLPPNTPVTDTPIILFLVAMGYAFGRLVRETVDRTQDARAGEELVTVEQARRLRDAVDDERRAVARDLHDVVAHGVSLVGVLAGAAQAQAQADPDRARASLDLAEATIAQVRVEVERLTAALGDADEVDAAPVDLADLERLVDDARRGGQTIQLELIGAAGVPAGVAASAYRIVQESLTNARKHASGAAVGVRIAIDGRALTVRVENGAGQVAVPVGVGAGRGAARGTGRGIAGMRERARLLGGELAAGATEQGGFRVEAHLPLERGEGGG